MMSQSESDLEAFRHFEKTAHDGLAKTYYDTFSVVTNQAIEPLLDAAQVREGTRLHEVASGPETLAGRRLVAVRSWLALISRRRWFFSRVHSTRL